MLESLQEREFYCGMMAVIKMLLQWKIDWLRATVWSFKEQCLRDVKERARTKFERQLKAEKRQAPSVSISQTSKKPKGAWNVWNKKIAPSVFFTT